MCRGALRCALQRCVAACGVALCVAVWRSAVHVFKQQCKPLKQTPPVPPCKKQNAPQQIIVIFPCPTHLATLLGWCGGHFRIQQRRLQGESEGIPHGYSISCSCSCRGVPQGDACRGCVAGHVRRRVSRDSRGACEKMCVGVRRGVCQNRCVAWRRGACEEMCVAGRRRACKERKVRLGARRGL